MSTPERSVRHLRLQAASRAEARRAALRLEDALRCATLPDTGRRVLFVRRLDLGRLDPGASAQAWALGLERALARAGLRWVAGDAPEAARAEAVAFRDALHAHLALGLRLARGPAPSEWFWPRLLPALPRAPDASAALAEVLHALAALPEAAAALPAWVISMVQAGQAPAVLAAVHQAERAPLWRALGGRAASTARRPEGTAGEPAEDAPAREARAWVVQALRLGGDPAAARRLETPARAAQRIDALEGSGAAPSRQDDPVAGRPATAWFSTEASAPTPPARAVPRADALPAAPAAMASPAARAPAPKPAPAAREWAALMGESWPWAEGEPTAAGGALFLVPVLERVGGAAWLEALPDAATKRCCVAALWERLFTRLGLEEGDPMWALAQCGPAETAEAPLPPLDLSALNEAEAARRPGHGRRAALWYGTTAAGEAQVVAERWLSLCRRWLRRRAGLGLRDLVRRPGWLLLSRTHADLVFDLDAVDLRVRRAGLDLDPSWVPWLGRVVGFHFERLARGEEG